MYVMERRLLLLLGLAFKGATGSCYSSALRLTEKTSILVKKNIAVKVLFTFVRLEKT